MDFAGYELADPDVRHEIYIAQGLTPSLVEFPEEAFEEGISSAKLMLDELSKEAFRVLVPASADPDERTNERRVLRAYATLRRLERALRDFIDREMTVAHGSGWEKHQLDPKILADWKEQADKARAAGQPAVRLIDFADFSHYTLIICRSDDFATIFEPRFRTKGSVRESFNRLKPLRHGIMHARVVSPSDSLFLVFESARLFKAIGAA